MIDEKKLLEKLDEIYYSQKKDWRTSLYNSARLDELDEVISIIEMLPKVGEWIPVTERLPKEHEEQHDIYDPETLAVVDAEVRMQSDTAQVTVEDDNGERFVSEDVTIEGEWETFREDMGFKVIAWRSMPEPYRGEADD